MVSFDWSDDPVALHGSLHATPPPLIVVDGKPTPARWAALVAKRPTRAKKKPWELIASYRDPEGLLTSGLLYRYADRWTGVYHSVLGMRPKYRKEVRRHREHDGLCNLTRSTFETEPHSLSAAWVDLDIRPGSAYVNDSGHTDYARLEADVLTHAVGHHLPPPTHLLRSGQGLWLLWTLRTHAGGPVLVDDPCPVLAWPTLRGLHEAIQRALVGIFQDFQPDDSVSDWRRVWRIPGSTHPNGQRVVWAHGPGGPLTLQDLSHALRLEPPAPPAKRRLRTWPSPDAEPLPGLPRASRHTKTTNRDKSARERWEAYLRHLRVLAADRDGFRTGLRWKALLIAVAALSRLHADEAVVIARLQDVNDAVCRPPLTEGEICSMAACAVRQRESRNNAGSVMGYKRCRALLAVTEGEQIRLGVFVSKPPANRGANIETQLALRDAIHTLYVVPERPCPSVRQVVKELEAHGYSSPRTGGAFDRRAVAAMLKKCGLRAA